MENSSEFSLQLDRIKGGDRAALDALLSAWRPVLRLQARGILGSGFAARADSSDVVQETMAQAFCDISKFRGTTEREWAAWLRTILTGRASKMQRFHLAGKRAVGREAAGSQPAVDAPEDPAAGLVESERLTQLAAAVERLSEPMQEVVFRRVFLGQPFEEVARDLGRSPGAARILWTRAIRRLRKLTADSPSGEPLNDAQSSA